MPIGEEYPPPARPKTPPKTRRSSNTPTIPRPIAKRVPRPNFAACASPRLGAGIPGTARRSPLTAGASASALSRSAVVLSKPSSKWPPLNSRASVSRTSCRFSRGRSAVETLFAPAPARKRGHSWRSTDRRPHSRSPWLAFRQAARPPFVFLMPRNPDQDRESPRSSRSQPGFLFVARSDRAPSRPS